MKTGQKKELAEESLKTKRAREKLKKHHAACESKITPHALKQKTIEIHRWISRHSAHRIVLKSKTISLFDENENAAAISQRISKITEQLESWKM